jgi:hypothetical protein
LLNLTGRPADLYSGRTHHFHICLFVTTLMVVVGGAGLMVFGIIHLANSIA